MEQSRERGNLLTIYKILNNTEILDWGNLLKWQKRDTIGYGLKLREDNYTGGLKKQVFPQGVRHVEWTGQSRGGVRSLYTTLKENLDTARYRDKTAQAWAPLP